MGDISNPTTKPLRLLYPVHADNDGPVVEVDHLIIGAGPAGASMGCFLGQHGLKGLIISAAPSTAHTPRAHIANSATFECLRDIGLDDEAYRAANTGEKIMHVRYCKTFLGREYARTYAWGQGLNEKYLRASPCSHADLPQTLLEPILLRYAANNGFPHRFSTELLFFDDGGDDGVVATVRDRITASTYKIKSKKLYGADGARSRVVEQLGLPFSSIPGGGTAYNVIFRADMSHKMQDRLGNLHIILRPDVEFPDCAWICIFRMVKPWYEWMAVIFAKPGYEPEKPPEKEEYLDPIKKWIGDDNIDVEILRVDPWKINEASANEYSMGNVFCLGDAVHRHPPTHGLGSNTCIQDSYNLAWKIAFVERGLAGKELLSTYNIERQPVGAHLVKMSNDGLRTHPLTWEAAGMFEPTLSARIAAAAELDSPTPAGVARRAKMASSIEVKKREFQGLGGELNHRYNSAAVCQDDEEGPWPRSPEDPVMDYSPCTYPGSRLPHAWLNTMVPGKRLSTVDLAGKGVFSLFTGMAGRERWETAATVVRGKLEVEIKTFVVGIGGDFTSQYLDWEKLREVEEEGCLLVRPDRFVAWRRKTLAADCAGELERIMRKVLCR